MISKFDSCYNDDMDMYDSKLTRDQIMVALLKWAEMAYRTQMAIQGEDDQLHTIVAGQFRLKRYAAS